MKENFWQWGEMKLANSFKNLFASSLLEEEPLKVPPVDCENCRCVLEKRTTWKVRCCDIVPRLANFLIGEILSNHQHDIIEKWIEDKRGDPYFIQIPPSLAKKYINARQDGHFGLPCPLLIKEGGACSLYHFRPPLCIGYHCYYPNSLLFEAWSCLTSTLELLQDTATRYLVSKSELNLTTMANIWDSANSELDLWENEKQKNWFIEHYGKIGKEKKKNFISIVSNRSILHLPNLEKNCIK